MVVILSGVLLLLLVLMVIYLLFKPISIRIDTARSLFRIRMPGIISIWPTYGKDGLSLHIKLPLKHFQVSKFNASRKRHNTQRKDKDRGNKKGLSPGQMFKLVGTVRVKQFRLCVDTDNYMLNSLLVPFFWWFTQQGISCSVNYTGQNYLSVMASTNLFRMGLALLRGKG